VLASPTPDCSLPATTRWLATVRNVAFIGMSLYSRYPDDYMGQWIVTFAALVLSGTAVAGLVLAALRRDSPATITARFLDSDAGILGVVSPHSIHGWDPAFIASVTAIALGPALMSWMVAETIRRD
jgi:hypothetical protein